MGERHPHQEQPTQRVKLRPSPRLWIGLNHRSNPRPKRPTFSIGGQAAAASSQNPLLVDPAKSHSISQVETLQQAIRFSRPSFESIFQDLEGTRKRRKQKTKFFTNFIEISYAIFTKAVLKYIKSARTQADRRD
jgi:hypothetical protein